MNDLIVLRARLRKRDKDIQQGIEKLGFQEEGMIADLVRDGVRKILIERGVMSPPTKPITQNVAQEVIRELMTSLERSYE